MSQSTVMSVGFASIEVVRNTRPVLRSLSFASVSSIGRHERYYLALEDESLRFCCGVLYTLTSGYSQKMYYTGTGTCRVLKRRSDVVMFRDDFCSHCIAETRSPTRSVRRFSGHISCHPDLGLRTSASTR